MFPSKITFIIAAFNEEKYISECIESCLNQSHQNIEICIVDDGSTDNTWDIISSYNNLNIKKDRFSQNKGKVAAFNRAFSMATGDFYALVGADDINYLDRASVQLNYLLDFNVDLTWGDYLHVDSEGRQLTKKPFESRAEISKKDILKDNCIPGGTMFFNRSVGEKSFPIPEELKFEDWWISFQSIFHFKIRKCDVLVLKYRLHDRNTVGNTESKFIEIKKRNYERHIKYHQIFASELEVGSDLHKLNSFYYYLKRIVLVEGFISRFELLFQSVKYWRFSLLQEIVKLILISVVGFDFLGKIKVIVRSLTA